MEQSETSDTIKARREGLAKLRAQFPENQISKLPKATCKNDEWKQLPKATCKVCGGYHATSKTIHLDYVGHAALTDRLLDADPEWQWEPMAKDENGLPKFDASGGLWIYLTVCGVTRPGYGNAASKQFGDPGNREKEIIGDALRNAAMRFGAALDLWHKGELHDDAADAAVAAPSVAPNTSTKLYTRIDAVLGDIASATTTQRLGEIADILAASKELGSSDLKWAREEWRAARQRLSGQEA